MNDMKVEEIKRIDRKLEHKGVIVDFYSDTMQLPDQKTAKWDFIAHKGAAAIVPVDENGNIIMVRQYRNAIEKYTLEIPAGALNAGEDRETAAIRECEEEIGYKAKNVFHLLDLYTTVAFCNEKIGIYCSMELEKSHQHLDEDEYLNIERHSLDSLVDMILTGKIEDAKTISAILAYKTKMGL
ncbi:MAG: NUDIX hydrolase [bacterium]|nr:NUDIX hydrolase [bacterium]